MPLADPSRAGTCSRPGAVRTATSSSSLGRRRGRVRAILAESGLDVLVLEAGPYMDSPPIPRSRWRALRALYRDGGLTIAEGRPAIPTPVGRAVGARP
jgi:hypothetical protein